jgi:outer membrane receptor for ferrienterochelin and colicin
MSPLEQGNPNLVPEDALSGEFGYQYQENQSFISFFS